MDMNGRKTISIDGNNFNANSTVGELYKLISDKEGKQFTDALRLIYGGKQIDISRKHLKLKDFGIQNNATLHGVLRLLGGSTLQPKPVKPDIRDDIKFDDSKIVEQGLTKKDDECDICWSNKKVAVIHKKGDTDHKVCAKCMYSQCRAEIWNGKTHITCPVSCEYVVPKRNAFIIAGFNKDEWKSYELRLDLNAICFKACPNIKCGLFVIKDVKSFKVKCPSCKAYYFCWNCLDKWRGNDDWNCGNATCGSLAALIHAITDSWDNKDGNTISGINGVPKIRACPNSSCQAVNEHVSGCKHMTCGKGTESGCKHDYCQVCLKPWKGCKCAFCDIFKQETCPGLGQTCKVAGLQQFQ